MCAIDASVELDLAAVQVVLRGDRTQLATATHFASGWISLKVLLSGTTIKVWVAGTLKLNTTDSNIPSGGLALTGDKPKFKIVKIGYDNTEPPDDDIDDAGDTIVYDMDLTNLYADLTHDDNGNLTADETFNYKYDALGRRIKKVITNRGDLDGTEYFYYNNRWQMLESRNGSEVVDTQTIYGTRYVDEIVRWWKDKRGAMYVLQDANWNVTSTTDYNAVPLDRVSTTPYGEPTFDTETVNGDADGDTDSCDNTALTDCFTTGNTGACHIFDYDDDDIDLWDLFDFLALRPADTILHLQPGCRTSPNHFPHAHQGIFLDEETLTYQNRHRQYHPWQKRFVQQDPFAFLPASFVPNLHYIDGLNRYAYVHGNPVTLVDSHGTKPAIGKGCRAEPPEPVGGSTCVQFQSCCIIGRRERDCPCHCLGNPGKYVNDASPGNPGTTWSLCGNEHVVLAFAIATLVGAVYLKRRKLATC